MENKEIISKKISWDEERNFRFKSFFEEIKITQESFSEKTGMPQSNLSATLNNKRALGDKIIEKHIKPFFPELNIAWLLTGKGEMLNNEKQNQKYTEGTEVLILPVSAEGGRLDGFSTQIRAEDCETIISPIKDVDFAMTVTGDSMYPEYPSGSKILVKKINEKAFIDWGRVYVLDTCNGAVIKKIMPGSTEGRIKCLSINEEYPSFEVAFGDIFGMYRVLMCMSLK